MASTGNVFAGTGENNTGIGVTAWTSPGNIVSDNATDATCNAGASSQYLVARNYSFALPPNATIHGVTVRIEASEHTAGTEVLAAQLQDASGVLFGSSKTATISGIAKAVYTYGSTSDLWGATITPEIVNDVDFGVRFWFTTAHDVRADYVTLAVEWSLLGGRILDLPVLLRLPGTLEQIPSLLATTLAPAPAPEPTPFNPPPWPHTFRPATHQPELPANRLALSTAPFTSPTWTNPSRRSWRALFEAVRNVAALQPPPAPAPAAEPAGSSSMIRRHRRRGR